MALIFALIFLDFVEVFWFSFGFNSF